MKENLDKQQKLIKAAGIASVVVAITLICLKLFAWNRTGSVSIFASFIDSSMDALASIINLIAIRIALVPADDEHRFGHGKAEALAGLAQASFIAGSAFILLLNAVDRIFNPRELTELNEGIWVMVISLVLTVSLVSFQKYVLTKTKSNAIKADSLHYLTDILTNIATIAVLFFSIQGFYFVDYVVGILLGIYILRSAWQIVKEALDILLDHELSKEVKEEIARVIMSHSEVKGFHDLKTRQTGLHYFMQFHLEIDDSSSLIQAHKISEEVEDLLLKKFPGAEAIIHIDPSSLYERRPREGFSNPAGV